MVKVTVYVLSGICAAITGLILSSQLTSAGPTAGLSYELTAIAAVVIGGASLMGGRGTMRGTLLGAFVIGFLSDGLVIIGISSYWQTVFTGAVHRGRGAAECRSVSPPCQACGFHGRPIDFPTAGGRRPENRARC